MAGLTRLLKAPKVQHFLSLIRFRDVFLMGNHTLVIVSISGLVWVCNTKQTFEFANNIKLIR